MKTFKFHKLKEKGRLLTKQQRLLRLCSLTKIMLLF